MHEEDEGNGRLMPCKAETHPLIWTQSAGEHESVQHPEEAFEVSIVLGAPATDHLHNAQTEHCLKHPHSRPMHSSSCRLAARHTQALSNIKRGEVRIIRGEQRK